MKFNIKIKRFLIILACITVGSFIISGIILYTTGGISAVSIKTTQIMKSEAFDAGNVNKLVIKTIDTDISIIPVVDKKISADFYGNARTNLTGFLPDLKTEFNNGVLTIEVSYPVTVTLGLINLSRLNLDIYVPDNFSREIACSSVSGDLETRRLELESFTFKSTSGNVNVNELVSENIKIETTSGKVFINDLEGSSSISTISGGVEADFKSLKKDLNVRTVSGDVDIKISEEKGFLFSLGSISGNIKNEFRSKITFADDKNLEGSVGEGVSQVIVKTISGDINLLEK
ncbi:MAG: DUF4097 domain-containing protein [Actinobacteria bacterium]|nr:DUF4097 domain-containing protein [Actinomycetota bacterium]